jgi:hypothetical protein
MANDPNNPNDNSELIGGVKVAITGDFSELAADFDAATQVAKDKASGMGAAISSAFGEAFNIAKDAAEGIGALLTTATAIDKVWGTTFIADIKSGVEGLATTFKAQFVDMASTVTESMTTAASSVADSAMAMGASLTSEVGATFTAAAAAAETGAASMAAAFTGLGGAAATAAPEVAAVGTAAGTAGAALSDLWAGLGTAAASAGDGLVFAGIAGAATLAAAAVMALVQSTNAEITAQAILASQLGTSYTNVATFQGAGDILGAGNSLLDLFGGSGLQNDLDQLRQMANGVSGLSQEIGSTFNNPETTGGIEQLVAAFQSLADPIDRANLAVQLFGKNATEGLALMNQATVDAVNHAQQLAEGYDTATRESIQRISDFGTALKNFFITPLFDFSGMWADFKQGIVQAATFIEEPFHTAFLQLQADWHDAMAAMSREAVALGATYVAAVPDFSKAQMDAIMLAGAGQSPATPASIATQIGDPNAFKDAANSVSAVSKSYSDLTSELGAAQSKLVSLQATWQADKSNAIVADQVARQQELVNQLKGTVAALDEVSAAWAAIGKAEGALGVTDFGKNLVDLQAAFATIQQNAGLFTSGQLEQATGNFQTAMDKLAESVRGGKAALDDFGSSTFSGPTLGYLASLQKSMDDTANSVGRVTSALNNWKVDPAPIQETIDEMSAFQTEADMLNDHLQRFQQTYTDLAKATLQVDIRSLFAQWDAPIKTVVELTTVMANLRNTVAGTAQILNAEGSQSTLQLANSAKLAADNYDQITKNMDAGKATIQDQTAAYNAWALAILKVNSAATDLQGEEQVLTAAIKNENAAGIDASNEQHARLDEIKTALSGQADLWNQVNKSVTSVFSTMSSGLTQALFDWQNFGKDITKTLQSIGQEIVKSLIDNLILTKSNIDSVTGSMTSLLRSIGIGGPVAGGAGGAVTDLAGGAPSISGAVDWATSGGGAGASAASGAGGAAGGASSLLGSLGSLVPIVGVAVQALSGIVQGFQMAHLENLTGEIEVTTRKIEAETGGNGRESIFGYTKATWMDLEVMTGQLSDLHNDNTIIIAMMEAGVGTGSGGGGTGAGSGGGADVFAALANMIQNMQDTISRVVAGSGGTGAQWQSIAQTVTGSQTLSGGGVSQGTLANPLNLTAQSATGLPTPGGAASDLAQSAGTAMDWWMSSPASASGGASMEPGNQGLGALMGTAEQNPLGLPQWQLLAGRQMGLTDKEASFLTINPGGGRPALDLQAMYAYYAANPTPQRPVTPNQSFQIPSTPVNNFNTGAPGMGGGSIPITVNALNPSSRGVADGIVQSLRQIGVKV